MRRRGSVGGILIESMGKARKVDESSIFGDAFGEGKKEEEQETLDRVQGGEEATVFWRWRERAGEKEGAAFPALNSSLAYTLPSG